MKFKIMIYVYFAVSIALFLYAANAFSQKAQVTYTRVIGQFTIIVSDALKDMTQEQLDQLIANVTGLKSEGINLSDWEKTETSEKEVNDVKVSDEKPNEKVRVVKYDIILKTGTDEKDPVVIGIRNDIATLRQYAIVPKNDVEKEQFPNESNYNTCNNSPENTNRECVILGDF